MAIEREVRIKIGASVGREVTSAFPSLETAAKKARATIKSEMKGAFDDLAREATGAGPKVSSPLIRAVDAMSKESKAKFGAMKSDFRSLASDAERELGRIERAARKATTEQSNFGAALRKTLDAQTRISASGLMGAAGAVGRPAMRAGRALFGAARTIGIDLLRGAGVQTDLAGMFQQGVQLESQATTLSNQAYIPGKNERVNPHDIVKQIRQVSNETAMDPTKALEGLQAFVAKTGDLSTGRDVLKDMAVLSRATGANMEDVVDAAGDVANNLGDVENKGQVVSGIMRAIAGQGKLGAVEMKDFASQMAKVGAAAGQFGGDKARNIEIFGALAQSSREHGGSATANQAATSVQAFTAAFGKGKRLAALDAFGVKYQNESGGLLDAQKIITDELVAAGNKKFGGMKKFRVNLGEMAGSQQALRAIGGVANTYQQTFESTKGTEAEKTAAATQAVTKEFNDLIEASMSLEETNESFQNSMNTTEAKVQIFNNKMSETADALRDALMPAIMQLAPKVLEAASAFATAVDKFMGGGAADAKTFETETEQEERMAKLRRQVKGGKVDSKVVAAVEEDQKAIEQDIARRQAELEAQRTPMNQRVGNQISKVTGLPSWMMAGIEGGAAVYGYATKGARKETMEQEERGIKSSAATFNKGEELLRQIHDGLMNKTLKVQIVGGTPAAPTGKNVRTDSADHP